MSEFESHDDDTRRELRLALHAWQNAGGAPDDVIAAMDDRYSAGGNRKDQLTPKSFYFAELVNVLSECNQSARPGTIIHLIDPQGLMSEEQRAKGKILIKGGQRKWLGASPWESWFDVETGAVEITPC